MKILVACVLAACVSCSLTGDSATAAGATATEDDTNDAGVAAAVAVDEDVTAAAARAATAAAAAADAGSGIPLPPPSVVCKCPVIYKPICGTDGRSYSNECILRCVNDDNVKNGRPSINVKSRGECPQGNCACSTVVDLVCGSDGHTYSNECYLFCESSRRASMGLPPITVVNRKACPRSTCSCSSIILPVCATDGRTYRNLCYLQCASRINQCNGLPPIWLKSTGACPQESCDCRPVQNLVCASDGRSYPNACLLACENRRHNAIGLPPLNIEYRGQCIECNCSIVHDPVCASDGKTYNNPCLLKCEHLIRRRKSLPPLVIVYKGVCGCNCPKTYDAVCASDGKTYGNICLLNCENIKRAYQGDSLLIFLYRGPCVCNCRHCNNNYQPVCGSDGNPYWNPCWLRCYSNCSMKDGGRPITLVKYGFC